jgi:hypothetical protein
MKLPISVASLKAMPGIESRVGGFKVTVTCAHVSLVQYAVDSKHYKFQMQALVWGY